MSILWTPKNNRRNRRGEIALSGRDLGGEIIDRVSLEILAGRLTVLAGPAGSGTTELLRLLAGAESPRRGSVTGDPAVYVPGAGLARQETGLSQGERRLVVLAREFAAGPRSLLADAVADGLDADGRRGVISLLRESVDVAGLTVVLGTSEPEVAAAGDRAVVLEAGRVVHDLDRPDAVEAAAAMGLGPAA